MTPVQPVRGTQSLLGEDADRLAAVVAAFDRVRRLFGFKRVEVPTIEQTAVFARTIGETTDVVSKEMYTFEDRGGESITLRPEFTAGICRAYLSEGWQQHVPLNFQPDLLDPLGRTIMISFRKAFLPSPATIRRQFQQERQTR